MVFVLQILSYVDCEAFFEVDEAFGDVFCFFFGGFIFIEVFVKGFNTHITTGGHQIGNSFVTAVEGKLNICFNP